LVAAGPGGGGQLGHPLLVALLAGGRLGLQLGLGLLQSGQPLGPPGQGSRQRVAAAGAVLLIVGPVGLGGLLEQLGHLGLEVSVGAVGRGSGVGGDLGAVQGDQPQADHAGRRAQLQRLDQQPSQGLFVANSEARDGHVIGGGRQGSCRPWSILYDQLALLPTPAALPTAVRATVWWGRSRPPD
jgi:hypothetical protein